MNFKLIILLVVFVIIQSGKASIYIKDKFLDVQNDFVSINNVLDNEDDEDIALKDIKELNFNASKFIKLDGKDKNQLNCEGSQNLCELYKGNLIKCLNENYKKNNEPNFRCKIIESNSVDESLEITNATIACNKPSNKLPGYIKKSCVLSYRFKFKEDDKDIINFEIKELNFDSSRTIKLDGRDRKQLACASHVIGCFSTNVKLIKCKYNNSKQECSIISSESNKNAYIFDAKVKCNHGNRSDYLRPPCYIAFKLRFNN